MKKGQMEGRKEGQMEGKKEESEEGQKEEREEGQMEGKEEERMRGRTYGWKDEREEGQMVGRKRTQEGKWAGLDPSAAGSGPRAACLTPLLYRFNIDYPAIADLYDYHLTVLIFSIASHSQKKKNNPSPWLS